MDTVTNPLMGSRIVHTIAVSRSNLAFGVAAQKNTWSRLPSDQQLGLYPSPHTPQNASQGRLEAQVRPLRGVQRGGVDPHVRHAAAKEL